VRTLGGVVTTLSYASNAANQLLTLTPSGGTVSTYAYDANGNLHTTQTGTAFTTNTWDVENRLVKCISREGD